MIFPDPEKIAVPEKKSGLDALGKLARSRRGGEDAGGARCLSRASVAQMLAAASIKVMDALFGLVARNDAEWTR